MKTNQLVTPQKDLAFLLLSFFIFLVCPVFASGFFGDIYNLDPKLKSRGDILFYSGFETDPWTSVWGIAWGPEPGENGKLVFDADCLAGRCLQVHYLKNMVGPKGGLQYLVDFSRFPIEPQEEFHLRYYVRFDPGFDFVKGGKLPGLAGGAANTGGHKPNGTDGWSARIMWRPGGKIVQYVYYPDQATEYGDDFPWDYGGCPRYFIPGQWYCVETYVRLNTPGKKDGLVASWLDGDLALEAKDLRFRDTPNLKIDKIYFSTFFGGNDDSWAPPKNEYARFDEFVAAKEYIGPKFTQVPTPSAFPVSLAVETPSPGSLMVYDGEQPRWTESHWDQGHYDFAYNGINHSPAGSKSLLVRLPDGAWGGAQLEGPEIQVGDYKSLSFWVYPTSCDVEFRVRLEEKGKQVGEERPVTSAPSDVLREKQWCRVMIPLSSFGKMDGFNRIVFNSNSFKGVSEFYLDDIQLLK